MKLLVIAEKIEKELFDKIYYAYHNPKTKKITFFSHHKIGEIK